MHIMLNVNCTRTTMPGCCALLAFIAPAVWAQQTVGFTNTDIITINTSRFHEVMVATPYPSIINVSGFPANEMIGKITVTLHGLSHGAPDDIDMLLVGPEGQNLIFLSDAGGPFVDPSAAVTVTLDDDAEASLPDETPYVSGTFRPSNYEQHLAKAIDRHGLPEEVVVDVFPEAEAEPATPEPSSATKLSVFAGAPPNGEWRLYVVDDHILVAGSIADGWSLTITTVTQSPPFRRGDSNQDGRISLTDIIVTLYALFHGAAQPACADAADADDDGSVSLTDAVYTLNYLFVSGAVPPAPGPNACGVDPTADDLPCDSYPPCPSSECPVGAESCAGTCVNPDFDNGNCGACGVVCPSDMTCSGGMCVPVEPCCGGF